LRWTEIEIRPAGSALVDKPGNRKCAPDVALAEACCLVVRVEYFHGCSDPGQAMQARQIIMDKVIEEKPGYTRANHTRTMRPVAAAQPGSLGKECGRTECIDKPALVVRYVLAQFLSLRRIVKFHKITGIFPPELDNSVERIDKSTISDDALCSLHLERQVSGVTHGVRQRQHLPVQVFVLRGTPESPELFV